MIKFAIFLIALALTALLSGCGSQPPKTITIEKPIPVPCLDKPIERPELPAINPALPDYELALALWIDHLDRTAYIAKLEAALAGCR